MTMRWNVTAVMVCLLPVIGCGRPKEQAVLAKDVVDFKQLYGENCAGCHGKDGKNGAALPLDNPLYLSIISKQSLHDVIAGGRAGTSMPAFAEDQGGPLNAKQVDAVVEGIEQSWARPVDLKGAAAPNYSAPDGTGDAVRGQQVFETACASCHGEKGKAGPIAIPSYLQLVSNQWIRTSTMVGRPDMGMPDWRSGAAGHALSDQDVSDVTAYVTSLRGGAGSTKNMGQESAK